MFDILFGWPKASKCKRAIKRARCRLKLLKNKREAIARQLRKDLAELIQSGHEETALNRVEQLIEDESLTASYELLDHYCEFLLSQFSYIRRHKDCPNDINEAASSLIFASARCGELPELFVIRKLFGERYSNKFATTAVELCPGNLVNKQLKENLSGKPVSDDLKYRMVDEIVRENCLQQQVLQIQYYPDWQQEQEQVEENRGYPPVDSVGQKNNTIAGSKVHPSEFQEIKRDVTCISSSISKPNDPCHSPKSTLIDVSAMQKKVVSFPGILSYTVSAMKSKEGKMALPSPAERVRLPPYPEEMVDNGNDIEERGFSVTKGGASQEQTLFKFRPSGLSSKENFHLGYNENDTDQDESSSSSSSSSSSEKSSIRASQRTKRAHDKRPRRRSASLESVGIKDTGCMLYYHKHGSRCRRKHQKPSAEAISQTDYVQTSQDNSTRRKSLEVKQRDCSLDQPCYLCLEDDKDCSESLPLKHKKLIRATHFQQGVVLHECLHSQTLLELVNITQRPSRKSGCDDGSNEIEIEAEYSASTGSSVSSANASNPRKETEPPYSRAMTMPQERRGSCGDKMLRTYSCPPPQNPNHVHPKLPDYDDIAAKFTALKRECQGNKL